MKIYSIKNLFTDGIYVYDDSNGDCVIDQKFNDCIFVKYKNIYGTVMLIPGKTCFNTKEEALAAAEEMRIKKIKSLEKNLKKIKEIKF